MRPVIWISGEDPPRLEAHIEQACASGAWILVNVVYNPDSIGNRWVAFLQREA